jgi:hypothetical protein
MHGGGVVSGDVAPRDRGQVRLMRESGVSLHDTAIYFGVPEAAVERTLEELRARLGASPEAEQWKQQQAHAVELAHSLYRLLGLLCQHPAHGRGSAAEAAWDLSDEIVWLLDPGDDRPVPRVREVPP